MANPLDSVSSVLNKLVSLTAQNSKPKSTVPNTSQVQIDQASAGSFHSVFHAADRFPLAGLQQLQTQRFHERPIGNKWNSNSEQNHIGQQIALTGIALGMLKVPESETQRKLGAWKTGQSYQP